MPLPSNENIADFISKKIESYCQENGLSPAQVLADTLETSTSSAYKKLRGEVTFSAPELLHLAQRFRMSLDGYNEIQGLNIQFLMPALGKKARSALDFLPELYKLLRETSGTANDLKIKYATNEIPLFYYLLFPELTAFKLYVWQRTVWLTVRDEDIVPIQAILQNEDFHVNRRRLLHGFFSSPSEEYYPINMMDTTLGQIAFLRDTGDIGASTADTLFGQVRKLTDLMETWATDEKKNYRDEGRDFSAKMQIYHNEIMYTNNLIYAESSEKMLVACTLDNPNYIFSSDKRVTEHIRAWFEKLRKNAQPISGSGERQRRAYFNGLRKRIELAMT